MKIPGIIVGITGAVLFVRATSKNGLKTFWAIL